MLWIPRSRRHAAGLVDGNSIFIERVFELRSCGQTIQRNKFPVPGRCSAKATWGSKRAWRDFGIGILGAEIVCQFGRGADR